MAVKIRLCPSKLSLTRWYNCKKCFVGNFKHRIDYNLLNEVINICSLSDYINGLTKN